MNTKKSILLVEDDRVDAMTVKRALKEIRIKNKLSVVENGEDAINYLRNQSNDVPGLIFLDLNMPKMNGIEFLRVIKQDEFHRRIPVIILSTSREENDKNECYNLGVVGYIMKCLNYKEFVKTMDKVNEYWEVSEFPEN